MEAPKICGTCLPRFKVKLYKYSKLECFFPTGSVFVRSVNKKVPCVSPGTSFVNQFWWKWDPVQVVMDSLTLIQDVVLQHTDKSRLQLCPLQASSYSLFFTTTVYH